MSTTPWTSLARVAATVFAAALLGGCSTSAPRMQPAAVALVEHGKPFVPTADAYEHAKGSLTDLLAKKNLSLRTRAVNGQLIAMVEVKSVGTSGDFEPVKVLFWEKKQPNSYYGSDPAAPLRNQIDQQYQKTMWEQASRP